MKSILLVALFLVHANSLAIGETPFWCGRLVVAARQTLTDTDKPINWPLELLRQKYGEKAYEEFNLKAFENDVEKIYISLFDPELAEYFNWEWLAKKWQLGNQSTEILKVYYSLLVFDGHPKLQGKRDQEILTLRKFLRENSIRLNPELNDQIVFFQGRLGKLSIPEIAKELEISEAEVYRKVNALGLSVVDAFKGDFGDGGSKAQEFIRHHLGIEPRGENWARAIELDAHRGIESELLVFLKDEGLTHQKIADRLNKAKILAGDPNHQRTAQSVAQKLAAMGYKKSKELGDAEVWIYPYGKVKESGNLIPEKVLQYVYEHPKETVSQMAYRFSVQEKSLESFLRKHHFANFPQTEVRSAGQNKNQFEDLRNQLPNLKLFHSLLQEKERFEEVMLAHLATAPAFPETGHSFWKNKSPVNRSKAYGVGNYSETGNNSKTALSRGRTEAIVSLQKRFERDRNRFTDEEQKNIQKALDEEAQSAHFDESKKEFSKKPVSEQKRIFEDVMLKHLINAEKFPSVLDPFWSKVSPSGRIKSLGLEMYSPTGSRAETALNLGHMEAIESLELRLEELQQNFTAEQKFIIQKALDAEKEVARREQFNIDFEAKPLREQREIFEIAMLEELHRAGKFPSKTSTFWKTKSPVGANKALGQGKYARGGSQEHSGLSPDRLTAVESILKKFEMESERYSPNEQEKIQNALHTELKAIKLKKIRLEFDSKPIKEQKRIIEELILSRLAYSGTFPVMRDPFWANESPVQKFRFFGYDQYAPEGSMSHLAINPSRVESIKSLQARFEANKSKFTPLMQSKIFEILETELKKASDN